MFLDRRRTVRNLDSRSQPVGDVQCAREHGWFLEFEFKGVELAASSPVSEILEALVNTGLPSSARQNVHTIVNELYINALDYGVLALADTDKSDENSFYDFDNKRQSRLRQLLSQEQSALGWIRVECMLDTSDRPSLQIIVADSGSGFQKSFEAHSRAQSLEAFNGRGLTLVKELASDVHLQPRSNQIKVLYKC
ncbi:MAG: ATP-binding protein [Pseudomonadales bacterium]